jgi:hypothetical protein
MEMRSLQGSPHLLPAQRNEVGEKKKIIGKGGFFCLAEKPIRLVFFFRAGTIALFLEWMRRWVAHQV